MNPETLANLVYAAAGAVLVWATLALAWPKLKAYITAAWGKRAGTTTENQRPQPLPAAWHFANLRKHFAETSQPGRVALMDERLAAGVFACKDCPANDLHVIDIRIDEVDDEGN